MSTKGQKIKKAFRCAFPYTIPIMTGFIFLGMTYGIYMKLSGFSFVYPLVMSFAIFGGSLEFLAVTMLLSPFAPLQVLLMTIMVQARHLFYGITMLDRYRGMGWKKFYLIFGMCDETFSVNCTAEIPDDVDKGWFYLFVTFLNRFYWIASATFGGILGGLIKFDTKGLDFVMTAMFVVIFLDQWLKDKHHVSEWVGLISSVVCLVVFGADNFMIPTMVCILLFLSILRKPVTGRLEEETATDELNRESTEDKDLKITRETMQSPEINDTKNVEMEEN